MQEQLDFDKTLQETIQKLSTFISGSETKSGGLQKEINNLKKSVPNLAGKTPEPAPASANAQPSPAAGSGLISQFATLFTRWEALREINDLISDADRVSELAREVQSPLRTRLRATISQGRTLSSQPPPDDQQGQDEARQKLKSVTTKFNQIANTTIPLAQELISLEESQASLRQWEYSAHTGYTSILKSFLIRLTLVLVGMAIVLVLSNFARRATFRYVREPRRRHQLVLLRHVITGALMAFILILGFVSEFGSLATFAGFLTAASPSPCKRLSFPSPRISC